MIKSTFGGFQKSAAGAPHPTGVLFGANLRKPSPEKSKERSEPKGRRRPVTIKPKPDD